MRKKIILLVLLGIFLGLGTTDLWFDKAFTKRDTNEYLMKWDLYRDNETKLNSYINAFLYSENEYGIYKSAETTLEDLTINDKVRIIYEYAYEHDLIKDDLYITYDKFNEISYTLFGENEFSFDEVNINNNIYLNKNVSHKRYDLIENDNKENNTYYVQSNGIKGAYQKENLIYFDVLLTFVRIDETGKTTYSNDITFTNNYCEKNCQNKLEYLTYRIYLEKNDNNGNYYFNKVSRLGSE